MNPQPLPTSKMRIFNAISIFWILSHYPPSKMWFFEAITRLLNPQPLPTFTKIPHVLPQLKLSTPSYLEGFTEKVIQGKLLWHKAKPEFLNWEATISLRTGWHFTEPCCVKRWQPHLSVSPCVNLYLYLLGSWAPPKAWHMVSCEAQNKNIASICTSTCFGEPISPLRKAGCFKVTLKKNLKTRCNVTKIFSVLCIWSIWSEETLPERITFTLGLLSKFLVGWTGPNMELNAISAYGKGPLHSCEMKENTFLMY